MNIIFSSIVNHGDTIVVAIVAVVLGWDKFRSGSSSLRKEINEDYKERNSQLEEKLHVQELSFKEQLGNQAQNFKEQIDKLTGVQNETNLELARMQTAISEKDKRISELREDLQGRNPAIVQLLQEISKSNEEIKEFMSMMHDEAKKAQEHQITILDSQVIRDKKIDQSSANQTGDIMRTN